MSAESQPDSPPDGRDPAAAPLVTVIVPAWNAERTLRETLESVAAQTYRNLEIIIVDDGSTDRTAAVAAEFCATEPRARLIRKANGGVASARNLGIEAARGEWVAPVDADDLWHRTKIEKQVAAARAAPVQPGFVYCWYHSIDEQGLVLGSSSRLAIDGSAFGQLTYANPVQNGSALLILRRAALAVGGYDSGLRACGSEGCEDVMIQLQIARRHPIALVPEHLVGYRKHADSMSRDNDQIIRSWRLVYQRLAAQGAPLPSGVARWSDGFFRMALAENRATAGSYAEAARHLLGAVRRDPLRWLAFLQYRIARTAMRLIRGRRPVPQRLHWSQVDPAMVVVQDVDDLPALARLVRAIDESRLRRLAARETPPA